MIFVAGKNGQVAQSLAELAEQRGVSLTCYGRRECDLMQPDAIAAFIQSKNPSAIINAAAYTAVDAAEDDEATAKIMNAVAPAVMAAVASKLNVPFIHVSTDYVFDGTKEGAYVETDPTGPTGAYGRTKLAGEQAVLKANPDAIILRTAWVYSAVGKNFLKTMLSLADREELGIVADQNGNPTYALDIADGILTICEKTIGNKPQFGGIYHMVGAGSTNWHGFAQHIFKCGAEFGHGTPKLNALTTDQYPTPANRPANSRLDCENLAKTFDVRLPAWEDSTYACVKRLSESGALS